MNAKKKKTPKNSWPKGHAADAIGNYMLYAIYPGNCSTGNIPFIRHPKDVLLRHLVATSEYHNSRSKRSEVYWCFQSSTSKTKNTVDFYKSNKHEHTEGANHTINNYRNSKHNIQLK